MFDSTSATGLNSLDDCEVMKKRRFLKRETKALKSQRSRSDGVAKMLPSAHIEDNSASHQSLSSQWNIIGTSNVHSTTSAGGPMGQRSSMSGQFGEWRQRSPMMSQLSQSHTPTSQTLTPGTNNSTPVKRTCHNNSVYLLLSDIGSCDGQSPNTSSIVTPSKLQTSSLPIDRKLKTLGSPPQLRGVPDGCPLDLVENHVESGAGSLHIGNLIPTAPLASLGAPSNQKEQHHTSGGLLLMKKGWLYLRQRYNGQGSLAQFTDPSAEEKGQARGTLDTRALRAATELDNADRNYAFALVWTPSGGEGPSRELVLSATTSAIRANWLQAIRQAAAASNALAMAPPCSTGTHGLTLATSSPVGSSSASITSGLTSSSTSLTGGSPGSAMVSSHSDNSRQFRRQLSPTRTAISGAITSTVTTTESIKDMSLPLGQEKDTASKRLNSRALSGTGHAGSPGDSGGEGSFFSATDSTPTQETSQSLATRQ
ncbi:hypothetical protein BIW11_03983 [Tropilaelaps mercedesae]|uniref:PH domain-containing protein n=1 Tax=Tropilaelaps mercedesae TaxID=418985 RepID=A0A1V9XDG4_9ACAR|nr:hypothetical protein BIW11_03983 [Tropilaelaps mercedesae]